MEKMLICYFSASGVTKKVAEKLSEITGSNLFEIKPSQEYTEQDLNWNDRNSRSSKETRNVTSRPEIKETIDNIDEYTTIFLGYPIWWDLAPRIINTFIESVDLSNKKVYVFATSGGSGVETSLNDLRRTYPNIKFISGKRLTENVTSNEVEGWLE